MLSYKISHILIYQPILKCTKYIMDTFVYDYNFDAKGKYQIYVYVFNLPKIMLKFNKTFIKERYYAYVKYNMFSLHSSFEKYNDKYKIFYSFNNISWALAYRKCLHKKHVPSNI